VGLRTALFAIALALAAPANAAAAEVSLDVLPAGGVRLGSATAMSGRVTDAGAPVAGRVVLLELRRYPFDQPWQRTSATATTAADGGYSFSRRLSRNHQVRVRLVGVAPAPDTVSPERDAYVLPAFTLSYDQRGTRMVRLRQTYTVPRDRRLTAPTRFYVGPCRPDGRDRCTATHARFRAEAETRRVRTGRFVAKAKVRIPKSFRGRFQYLSCFAYSPGSGMGDPDQRCPRRYARLH
jgi:hypothetical protein